MSKDGLPKEAPPAYEDFPPAEAKSAPINDIHVISDGVQQEQTIVITSTTVLNLTHKKTDVTCPFCLANVQTSIKQKPNSTTHMYGLLLCLIGGILCCMIPYCLPQCQTTNHYCPNCKNFLGSFPVAS